MSENESVSTTVLNERTDASVAARTAAIAASAPRTAPKPKTAKKAAPAPAPAATGRVGLTPKERASRPATANIVAYVDFLEKTLGRKFSGPERRAAEVSITLYGAYQKSDARRTARGY